MVVILIVMFMKYPSNCLDIIVILDWVVVTNLAHFSNSTEISFNKELKPYIVLPKRSRSGIFINFGLCLKSIEQQTPPFFVGFARIALSEISTTKLTCHKMCPIMNESGMSIGTMSVKLELGSRGLHFGQTLIGKPNEFIF